MIYRRPKINGYDKFAFNGGRSSEAQLALFAETSGVYFATPLPERIKSATVIRFHDAIATRVRTENTFCSWRRTNITRRNRYVFYFVHRGRVVISGEDDVQHREGDGVGIIFPGTGDVSVEVTSESDFVEFSFDKSVFHGEAIQASDISRIPSESPVFWASFHHLIGLLVTPQLCQASDDATALHRMTIEVARGLIAELQTLNDRRSIDTILALIDTNYMSQLFTQKHIYSELSISRRTLERICAEAGCSPAVAIRERRVRHAEALLLKCREAPVPIWAASGFTSSEAMRRAFLSQHGVTSSRFVAQFKRSPILVHS